MDGPVVLGFWRRLLSASPGLVVSTEDGLDGGGGHGYGDGPPTNRASHKPHAVIANGILLQRERQALRWLQATCKQHDVPLFILLDPRHQWKNQQEQQQPEEQLRTTPKQKTGTTALTDDDLERVLRRQVVPLVKQRLIRTSLRHSAGTAFANGRALGRWEGRTQAWLGQQTRMLGPPSNTTTKVDDEENVCNDGGDSGDEDWSALEEDALRRKLESRGVIVIQQKEEHHDSNQNKKIQKRRTMDPRIVTRWVGTDAILSLARHLIRDHQQEEGDDDEQGGTT